jgi:hypothetical protein
MKRPPARIAFIAVIALTLITVSGLSVMRPGPSAHRVAFVPASVSVQVWKGPELKKEPVELSLPDELRAQCADYSLPPEPYVFESTTASDADEKMLQGLAACLQSAPLAGHTIELIGPTDLPGASAFPTEAAGAADAVRSLLARLGVPFSAIRTHDQSYDPSDSDHASPRVVLSAAAPAGEAQTTTEVP